MAPRRSLRWIENIQGTVISTSIPPPNKKKGILSSEKDLNRYRKRRDFEKMLSVYKSPYLPKKLRQNVLRILFRVTSLPGGSQTLITRCSIISWLRAEAAVSKDVILKALTKRLWETCDQEYVRAWSGGHLVINIVDVT
jgi:nucleolar pre-ribosomal-associated protein 1